MRLYSGSSQQFISDSIQNQVAEKLKSTFFGYYRYYPSPSEVDSWRNSLRAMSQVIQYAGIKKSGVLLEYQLPLSSKRLDCMFTGDDVDELASHIANSVDEGDGLPVLARIEQSEYRQSKKLMDHIGHVIKGKSAYVLLDEQLVAYDKVLAAARKGFHDKKKRSIIIKGGPGTGKSVIALNLMADLLLNGYNEHYATGSRAFTETLRKIIGPRGSILFKYFNSYVSAEANEVDVLISDEAHRIRETSNSRFTRVENKSKVPQIEELMRVAKVGVYLIDDQIVIEIDNRRHTKRDRWNSLC